MTASELDEPKYEGWLCNVHDAGHILIGMAAGRELISARTELEVNELQTLLDWAPQPQPPTGKQRVDYHWRMLCYAVAGPIYEFLTREVALHDRLLEPIERAMELAGPEIEAWRANRTYPKPMTLEDVDVEALGLYRSPLVSGCFLRREPGRGRLFDDVATARCHVEELYKVRSKVDELYDHIPYSRFEVVRCAERYVERALCKRWDEAVLVADILNSPIHLCTLCPCLSKTMKSIRFAPRSVFPG